MLSRNKLSHIPESWDAVASVRLFLLLPGMKSVNEPATKLNLEEPHKLADDWTRDQNPPENVENVAASFGREI